MWIYPAPNAMNVDVSQPFQWTHASQSVAYHLQILADGTSTVVRDSGEIRIPRYFADDLPRGAYTARLGTKIAGVWLYCDSSFEVGRNAAEPALPIQHAQWAASFVRAMADSEHRPLPGTPLWTQVVTRQKASRAICYDYAAVLAGLLKEMNLSGRLDAQHQPRVVNVSFVSNRYDMHSLVEMFHPDDNAWVILDPTFELMAQRASSGHWAGADDIHHATIARDWAAISYVCFGMAGDRHGIDYYLDYPLLFLNILPATANGLDADPRPYLRRVPELPSGSASGTYIISSSQTPLPVLIDDVQETLDCGGIHGFSRMFFAASISVPAVVTGDVQLWQPQRYVFKRPL